ncbi:helix-turn-helix domain-containing protein [Streptomyces sp. NPDC018019]|uniref:helix-turn-helix domain-containing protein n=1 Tax=Streptomyces sp. NPDC018019 TaxID=3365030 RepID=UPI0037A0DF7C
MAYRLVLAREARSRLNGLRRDESGAARLVGEAVTALLAEGVRLGPPLLVPVGAALRAVEPREALDHWYQRRLTLLAKVRRALADVQASRRQLDRQAGELERQAGRLAELEAQVSGAGRRDLAEQAADRLSTVRQRQALLGASSAEVRAREAALAAICRRVQDQADVFLSRRAGVEAVQRAGHAQQEVHDALGEAADVDEVARAGADGAVAAARAATRDMADGAERLEREVYGLLGTRPPAAELYELRLAALTGRDLRVLCTVEEAAGAESAGTGTTAEAGTTAGAVVLLAVAVDLAHGWDWYERALPRARKRLAGRERRGREPGAEDVDFWDGRDFLRDWYPGSAEERHGGAARLVSRNQGQRLASVRRHRGLTQRQLAGLMGVSAARVAALEQAGPGAAGTAALAAYVAALGGRLEIVADFDTERLVLR